MKPENLAMSKPRADVFARVVGERDRGLVDKYFRLAKTRGMFSMAKMPKDALENLCGELIYLSHCDELTSAEKRTFSNLAEHANAFASQGLGEKISNTRKH